MTNYILRKTRKRIDRTWSNWEYQVSEADDSYDALGEYEQHTGVHSSIDSLAEELARRELPAVCHFIVGDHRKGISYTRGGNFSQIGTPTDGELGELALKLSQYSERLRDE